MQELRHAVDTECPCPLKLGAHSTVFADGDPQAHLMVIGEAPGAQEDKLGKPFVGRSGKLLDAVLAEAEFSRHEGPPQARVYITNSVFWRPPDNRPPTRDEIAACRPYLMAHIGLVAPRVLLLVGHTAAKAVLETKMMMGDLRETPLGLDVGAGPNPLRVPVVVTYHPAYVLRNPAARPAMVADIGRARAVMVR